MMMVLDLVRLMALLQTDHENAAWLAGRPLSPMRLPARRFAHFADYLLAPIRRSLDALRQSSMRRHIRAWRSMRERAQQRRALAQLSDRELRDICITRYEVEFLLRRSAWR
jgi:uncharacterized protein YjiS (DUF1127 family)